ncbi:MAG: bactofilin family protein [Planctomycetota bacterium]|jgi:cytoskeletal protein CcmA (bactofilin family)
MADTISGKPEDFATVIGKDAKFKGELSFQGGVRVDGHFEGAITTDGQVLVSKGGMLKAEVKAGSLALEGQLEGNVVAQHRVELRASGQMRGDVTAAKLMVVEGATFVGRCEVGPGAQAASRTTTTDAARAQVAAAAAGRK